MFRHGVCLVCDEEGFLPVTGLAAAKHQSFCEGRLETVESVWGPAVRTVGGRPSLAVPAASGARPKA
jgi:hypothetical protein